MSTRSATARSGPGFFERWGLLVLAVVAVGVILTATLLSGGGGSEKASTAKLGKPAPAFSVTDAVSGQVLSLDTFKGKRTLLFFSEGVACQACMVQIRDLEKNAAALRRADITLVHISVDPVDALADAGKQYGIKTPLLADESAEMSKAYNMLGKGGMEHPNADGHAFMLLDGDGKVAWEQAYAEMYVPPKELLAAIPKASETKTE